MPKKTTVSEAQATLPEILDRVEAGEEVTITRKGKPAAVVVRPSMPLPHRADQAFAAAEHLHEMLVEARSRPLEAMPGISEARAEEILADLRASRSRGDPPDLWKP